jgi:hypothetical protein
MNNEITATVKIKNIGPDDAADMLANLWPQQRSPKPKHIDRLAEDMRAGRFFLSPDCILLVCGKLANGQNRMRAVIEVGRSFPFLVMECENEELYQVIDSGAPRTARDVLVGEKFATHLPRTASYLLAYYECAGEDVAWSSSTMANLNFSRMTVLEFVQQHKQAITEALEFCGPLYKQTQLIPVTVAAAVLYIATKSGHVSKAERFLRYVYVGVCDDGSEVSQAVFLRNRLIANKGSKAKLSGAYVFALTMHALRAFINNSELTVLRHREGQPIPVI